MEYVLETNALTKRYKSFTALSGLTMRIPKGAIYGFVGRNGAADNGRLYSLRRKEYGSGNYPQPPQNGSCSGKPGNLS